MDISGLALLLSAAVFIATILLAIVCLDCKNKSPASITQKPESAEYVPSSGFVVIHPCQPRPEQNSVHSPSNLMPHPNSANRGSDRRLRPCTPTETESNPSYENPVPGTDFQESDAEDNGYIKVLPGTEESRASTPSSDNHYVNVEEAKEQGHDSDSDSEPNYLNVNNMHHQPCSTPDLSSQSEAEDDNNEENYVNQPPLGDPLMGGTDQF